MSHAGSDSQGEQVAVPSMESGGVPGHFATQAGLSTVMRAVLTAHGQQVPAHCPRQLGHAKWPSPAGPRSGSLTWRDVPRHFHLHLWELSAPVLLASRSHACLSEVLR